MKMDRRDFSKALLMTAGYSAMTGMGCSAAKPERLPIAVQLYTLRELMSQDFKGTIEKVAAMGYPGVEFAGYNGMSAKELKSFIDGLGLACAGTHEGFEGLQNNLQEKIDFNLGIGNELVVVPSMPGKWRENGAEGIKEFAERMNVLGQAIKDAGMQLCYHNHAFEFEMVDGKSLYEIMFEIMDPALVMAEVDIFWVVKGGVDPLDHLKKYAGRCPLLHMKDMNPEDESFAPVGTGSIDLQGVVDFSKQNGTRWYVVEQDRTKRPVLEAVEISLRNLEKMLKA